jgi:hypothetical protein
MPMALMLPKNWCLCFCRDPDGKITNAQLGQWLKDRGLTVTGTEELLKVQWRNGPILSVSTLKSKTIETVLRGLVGRRRKYHDLVSGCDTQVKIELSDIDEVLDEMNTLIEVQATIQQATKGLVYTSWNDNFSGPED